MRTQLSLLGNEPPSFDAAFPGLTRERLDAHAWLDLCPGWVTGNHRLFRHLESTTTWHSERRRMYEREVDVPRLTARFPNDGPGHPLLTELVRALSSRYDRPMDQVSAAWYRDGRDSVALHGDRVGRHVDDCVVAIVSLGEARRFVLKPVAGGPSRVYRPGHGDLLVMGGRCQRDWLHGVPKAARAGARISVQFRPSSTCKDAASERHDEAADKPLCTGLHRARVR